MNMKRLSVIIACLALTATMGWAQSGMTDNQVLQYVIQERAKGTSQSRIVTHLMQRGVTAAQIRKVRKAYGSMQNGTTTGEPTLGSSDKDRMRVNNGVTRLENGNSLPTTAERNRDDYDDQQQRAAQSSHGRISAYNTRHTYDDNDPEYQDVSAELDAWMPQDTAMLVKRLQAELEWYQKGNYKKVYGRDIFNRADLTFEPEMNIASSTAPT